MINQFSSRPLEDYVTVLAIYDDPPSNSRQSSFGSHHRFGSSSNFRSEQEVEGGRKHRSLCVAQNSPTIISVDSSDGQTSAHTVCIEPATTDVDVVEVTSLDEPPNRGLQVVSNNKISAVRPNLSANSSPIFLRKASEEKEARSASMDPSPAHLSSRNNARKSRFTDAFLDAKERLEQEFEHGAKISVLSSGSTNFRYSKILLSSETVNVRTGVEISAVPDLEKPNRIIAVEVVRIEDGGRISEDGRIKVGDQITEINGHPCSQMSLARARLYLRDLEELAEPSLAFNRQIETARVGDSSTDNSSSIVVKPIKTALQQGNTSKIGETLDLVVRKNNGGFGFSFAGRFNAMNEHLFYVKTVKSGGASCGILKIGDRLLRIDGKDLSNLQQPDVTALLKSKEVGDTIAILVSRIPEHTAEEDAHAVTTPETPRSTPSVTFKEDKECFGGDREQYLHNCLARKLGDSGCELVELDIPLNDSPSAGLGISLKAQRIYNDGLASDSGLYIRSVLHGSAAYKDGRLRIDDRLVAIQDVNLLKYKLNGEALEAFIKCLSMMPSNACSVKVFVARKKDIKGDITQTEFVINRTVIPPSRQDVELSSMADLKHHGVDESESDISVVQDDTDAFVRDTVTRKSISEKRPLGIHNDPSHLQTYQRIKHNRQTSASPKRRPASIEPFAAGRSFDSRTKKEEITPASLHRRVQSSALPKSDIPNSISQPALGSVLKNYERAPLSSISHLKEDRSRAQRRKSTGSGFLKFLHKVGPSSSSPEHFHVGDEQSEEVQHTIYPYHQDQNNRTRTCERREEVVSPKPYPQHNPYSSPEQSRRRAPPPPYHRPPIYAGATYPYHQRVYSAQEPYNYREMRDGVAQVYNEGIYMGNEGTERSCAQSHMPTSKPSSRDVHQRHPSTTTLYYSDATNFHHHPSTYPLPPFHSQTNSTTTTNPASHANPPPTTTTPSMPGLHTARRCRLVAPPPIPPHQGTKTGQHHQPALPRSLHPRPKPGSLCTRPPNMGTITTRVREERPTPSRPMNPFHSYQSTTDSRIINNGDSSPVYNSQSLDCRRTKNNVELMPLPRTYFTTTPNPARNSAQNQQQRSKMRKAVASAVFYDDCEAPVRC